MLAEILDYAALEHDPDVSLLARAIHARCGIDYRGNLYSLAIKAGARVTALGVTFARYLRHLDQHPTEWDALIEAITVNETYFFREECQLEELARVVLPELADRDEIRIWSAACSTGEEPYSLAMTILESGVVPLDKVRIYATDINRKVLKSAEQGFYPAQSMCFRRTPERMKKLYFDEEPGGFRVKEHIRDRVRFMRWNLLHDAAGLLPVMDVIFCRNVLIYFDEASIRTVASHLSGRLAEGGYLFLGHAETVSGLVPGLHTINAPSTFYYRKEGGTA
jgi:Methylase of chemotaxis methyl-accepting proteins